MIPAGDADAEARQRLTRLATLDVGRMAEALTWLAGYSPAVFDATLDATEPCTDDDTPDPAADPEPFCLVCGSDVGIFLRFGLDQRVFSEVVELYLQRIDFAPDGYAQLIRLPQYRVAEVTVDPDHAFGRPRFAHGGASVDDVIDLFRAGEPVDAVAGEFGLSRGEVEDAIRVVTRAAA